MIRFKWLLIFLFIISLVSCKALKENCDCPNFSDKQELTEKNAQRFS